MAKLEKEKRPLSLSWMSWFVDPVLVVTISLIFAVDQVTKAVVRHNLLLGESVPRDGVVRITHTFNTGSAFGLFPDQTLFLILASFVAIIILLLVYRNHPLASFPLRLSLGMQLGGASGNLVDRLRMGQVTDFVDLGFWPVFNVADASIVGGIIIVAGMFLFTGRLGKLSPEEGRTSATIQIANDQGSSVSVPARASSPEIGKTGVSTANSSETVEYDLCPICDSEMNEVPGGWRCSGCGVKEQLEDRGLW